MYDVISDVYLDCHTLTRQYNVETGQSECVSNGFQVHFNFFSSTVEPPNTALLRLVKNGGITGNSRVTGNGGIRSHRSPIT